MPRASLLTWARAWCPDLRIAYALGEDGKVACCALFTLEGEAVEVGRQDDPDGRKVLEAVVERVRASMGVPRLFRDDARTRRDLERRVVVARVSGNDAEADRLTQELLEARTVAGGRALGWPSVRSRIGGRST